MEVASTGVPNGVSTPDTATLVDSGAVIQYLTEVLQVTLGALKSELETAGSLLSAARYNETVQRCTRFASETQVALYVQKDIAAAEETNGETEGSGEPIRSGPTISSGRTLTVYDQNRRCSMSTRCPLRFLPLRPRCRPWLLSNALLPSTRLSRSPRRFRS